MYIILCNPGSHSTYEHPMYTSYPPPPPHYMDGRFVAPPSHYAPCPSHPAHPMMHRIVNFSDNLPKPRADPDCASSTKNGKKNWFMGGKLVASFARLANFRGGRKPEDATPAGRKGRPRLRSCYPLGQKKGLWGRLWRQLGLGYQVCPLLRPPRRNACHAKK